MSGPREPRPSRGRRLGTVLVLLLLVVPVVEIIVIIAVGQAIGGWQTLALLLFESALGAWLVRREGSRAWAALSGALTTGRMPAGELADAALVLVGGTLLLAPGFVTDVFGFLFVLPFTRPFARAMLTRVAARRLLEASGGLTGAWSRAPGRGPVVQGHVVDPPHVPEDEQTRGEDEAGRTG